MTTDALILGISNNCVWLTNNYSSLCVVTDMKKVLYAVKVDKI